MEPMKRNYHDRRYIKNQFRQLIKKWGDDVELKESLKELQDTVFSKLDAMRKEIERTHHQNKPSTPFEYRYIKYEDVDSGDPKMTYRPSNGELLIKIPKNTPKLKRFLLTKLGLTIIEELPDEVKITLRGTPHWSESQSTYRVNLKDNNKSCHSFNFEIIY